jgi:hypothetical protein
VHDENVSRRERFGGSDTEQRNRLIPLEHCHKASTSRDTVDTLGMILASHLQIATLGEGCVLIGPKQIA